MSAQTEPSDGWTPAERWVWDRLRTGEIADLNGRDSGPARVSWEEEHWAQEIEARTVRPATIAAILTREPWCEALPATGLRVVGAFIPGGLTLEHLQLPRPLWLERCRIDGDLSLRGTSIGSDFSLDESCITGATTLSAMRAGYVSWKGTRFESDVEAILVRYELSLHAWDARFGGRCVVSEARIGGGLSLSRVRARSDVDLSRNVVSGDVSLDGARITGQLDCLYLRASSLGLAGGAGRDTSTVISRGVRLHGAVITGNLALGCLRVGPPKLAGDPPAVAASSVVEAGMAVEGQQIEVTGWLRLGGVAAHGRLDLSFGRVGGMDMRGARALRRVDLHGVQVSGEFLLDHTTRWQPDALLDLRNAKVGSLQDSYWREYGVPRDAWPDKLHLHGFSLDRLGGFGDQGHSSFMDRPPNWFTTWLERTWDRIEFGGELWPLLPSPIRWLWPTYGDAPRLARWLLLPRARNVGYRPSTYRTFAAKLRELGRPTTADRLEFASREIERRNAVFPRSTGLWLQRWTIGYGIGGGYFLSLAWAIVLAALCVAVGMADGAIQKPLSWWVLACVDHVLPIVSFEKEYGEMLPAKLGHWWSKVWFDAVTLVSWVIGLMLAAGIAGITQRAK